MYTDRNPQLSALTHSERGDLTHETVTQTQKQGGHPHRPPRRHPLHQRQGGRNRAFH